MWQNLIKEKYLWDYKCKWIDQTGLMITNKKQQPQTISIHTNVCPSRAWIFFSGSNGNIFSLLFSHLALNVIVQAVKFLSQKPQYVEENTMPKKWRFGCFLLLLLHGSFWLELPGHSWLHWANLQLDGLVISTFLSHLCLAFQINWPEWRNASSSTHI